MRISDWSSDVCSSDLFVDGFGIYFPKFTGTIYELLSAPVSYLEVLLGYVGAAATKSVIVGAIILATAGLFVPLHIDPPVIMVLFLALTSITFSRFGFIIGLYDRKSAV